MNVANERKICLAGGCFWGVQGYFNRINGVLKSEVGYANGEGMAYYEGLKSSGHAEVIMLTYDSNILSLAEILYRFISIIDPTSLNRQGNDIGTQYRSGIYYENKSDLTVIKAVLDTIKDKFNVPIMIECKRLENYTKAEEYHQNYLDKNPNGYCHINIFSANEPLFITQKFKIYDDLKSRLSPLEYSITQQNDTEQAFTSPLYEEKSEGLYVDITSGEPLFSSMDKFNSGTGWPSFTKPISTTSLAYFEDFTHGLKRVEVRAKRSNSHLGHVFDDGMASRGGLRYCINGASLNFIPKNSLKELGYAEFEPFLMK
ncbi:peptide-methionine (R)-S-oxide reductase MsrB [Campylobacter sp. 19-13652]|uniref:peptide-methionine (R)-S-oxide reductase MsrB n=1 Tax=Campylobacter sp. 19-13652 TaxID=2840180 RepID=UPI001C785536|nr:peptide-methionine (R)-S-oxide reductase MsrB [Campylobacter sp. 19-13652]BCX79495.1 hypothetical protein LBC_09570 [Campylobacter sp. 19-13652]